MQKFEIAKQPEKCLITSLHEHSMTLGDAANRRCLAGLSQRSASRLTDSWFGSPNSTSIPIRRRFAGRSV
jgi:hypothetical protein